jgi:hypothetical protein
MPGMDPETCAKNVVEKAGADVVVVLLTAAVGPANCTMSWNQRLSELAVQLHCIRKSDFERTS